MVKKRVLKKNKIRLSKFFLIRQLIENFLYYLKRAVIFTIKWYSAFFDKYKNKKIKHRYAYLIIFATACVCFIGFFFALRFYSIDYAILLPVVRQPFSVNRSPLTCEFERSIDGVCVISKEAAAVGYVGVMIENSVDARPLSGLADSSLVVEALVESSITRFLAFYPMDATVEKIGPVRSARTYFLDWVRQFNALYSHVGGSPDALRLIDKYEIADMDEYFNGAFYWRSKERVAPHNTYTSLDLLRRGIDGKNTLQNQISKSFEPWIFKDGEVLEDRGVDKKIVQVVHSIDDYKASWLYFRESNRYTRYHGLNVYKLSDGRVVEVDSIIIIEAPHKVIDDLGRREIDLTNDVGRAWLLIDGHMNEIRWRRKTEGDRFVFLEKATEREVFLNRGKIWIHIIPEVGEKAFFDAD